MDTKGSNLRKLIAPVVAAVNEVMTVYYSPNRVFDPMVVKIGKEEVGATDEAPQIYWRPVKDSNYEWGVPQPSDNEGGEGEADYYTWTTCEVKVWGANLDEAERLRDAVLTKAVRIYSGAGFKPVSGGVYSDGVVGQDGVSITFQVAFEQPIMGVLYQDFVVKSVNAGILVSDDADDPAPELLPQ